MKKCSQDQSVPILQACFQAMHWLKLKEHNSKQENAAGPARKLSLTMKAVLKRDDKQDEWLPFVIPVMERHYSAYLASHWGIHLEFRTIFWCPVFIVSSIIIHNWANDTFQLGIPDASHFLHLYLLYALNNLCLINTTYIVVTKF
jgi:hypothetical protein